MKVVAISQPMYFPWPGFMEMMKRADAFIWLDDAQFSKGSFTNRIKVKLDGALKWMTVPLEGKGAHKSICDLKASDEMWRKAHRALLKQSLRDRPFSAEALDVFDRALDAQTLCEQLIRSAEQQARALNATPAELYRASQLDADGRSWRRVIDLVKAVGGAHYISGAGGARYIDHDAFEAQGLTVSYMKYDPEPWPQGEGPFTPFVTSLDLIASRGPNAGCNLRPGLEPWRERLANLRSAPEDGAADGGAGHDD